MSLEAKATCNERNFESAKKQINRAKALFLETFFGKDQTDVDLTKWKFFGGVFSSQQKDPIPSKSEYFGCCKECLPQKIHKLHDDLKPSHPDGQYNNIIKYLLFFSTMEPVPINSILNETIQRKLDKAGSAKNVALWNWTCGQKSC